MTYSIVALDPATGELRVAVQTRWFGVGAIVPWVEAGVTPVDELARLLRIARAYEDLGEAEDASLRGDHAAAAAAQTRSAATAPDDDQILLWAAVGLAIAGRSEEGRAVLATASEMEPRSGEHLRRFAEAGHLPGGEETLRRLGLE